MIVQIYEASNPEEAREIEKLGVDHIGVLVGKTDYPHGLSLEETKAIFNAVSDKVKKVALSLHPNLKKILEIIEETKPDIIHLAALPNDINLEDVKTIKQKFPNVKVMRTIPVIDEKSIDLAKEYNGVADYLLLDSYKQKDFQVGATGKTHNWDISRKIVESVKTPVILAGGLGPDNVEEAIRKVKPFGVDSKTKTDEVNGQGKDLEKVKEFVIKAKSVSKI